MAMRLGVTDNAGVYRKLERLRRQAYVAKHYESSYRLRGRPAAYYLLPAGLRWLQANATPNITRHQVRYSHHDARVTERFIDHTLALNEVLLRLAAHNPALTAFTTRQIRQYSGFPEQRPQAFIAFKTAATGPLKRCFLDVVLDNRALQPILAKTADYSEYFAAGNWDHIEGGAPTILLVAGNERLERRLQRALARYAPLLGSRLTIATTYMAQLRDLANQPDSWLVLDGPITRRPLELLKTL